MPNLSWNEIEHRATEFAATWRNETYEKGESQSFWSGFLSVFGIDRKRHGAYFEYAVKKINNRQGFIDLFWPGKLLAEQKSAGRDLSAANIQAFDYLHALPDSDLPQYIVVSDFANFELVNLETRERTSFMLDQLPKKIRLFGFLIGRDSANPQEEDPVNRRAAETMARLHNQLAAGNYTGHELELLLVRLVFCLFADDAGIFERGSFEAYLAGRTSPDGSDLGGKLAKIFETLNTPPEQRQAALDYDLAALPYVNGGLFAELTRMPDFTGAMRRELLAACDLDWAQVSPAIFGSMFQGVMDADDRRSLGAHYTSERNIMKIIKPLFLDELDREFDKARYSKKRLAALHDKLASLTFLDPACGCGNFLVVTYRELRKLEHQVLSAIHGRQALLADVTDSIQVNVDQMYGIEIGEFPALIAEAALWLTDHQMNLAASQQFGRHFARLPLTTRANITRGNALQLDWQAVIPPARLSYILGNPPFVGSKFMTAGQRAEVLAQFPSVRGAGVLDYVSAWYAKAAAYMTGNKRIQASLVSTNSITQGEQVGVLWSYLLGQGIHITFAHQTFRWSNEGKGIAAVYCVIVGFSFAPEPAKLLYTYADVRGEPEVRQVGNISPYLVEGPDVVVTSRSRPLGDMPPMMKGSQPTDDGNLLLDEQERADFLRADPDAGDFIRPFVGAHEFINRQQRWCLWLKDAPPEELRKHPAILNRIARVRAFRAQSRKDATRRKASTPTIFDEDRQPTDGHYLIVPSVSSERRAYIPIGFMPHTVVASNLCLIIPDATPYHFGILTSAMHMAWVRVVCGRLKSDYRYSKDIVYHNFPWPDATPEQQATVARLAQGILDARARFPDSSLADLYDPRSMPAELARAHQALDRCVDKLYQHAGFESDGGRLAMLLRKYESNERRN